MATSDTFAMMGKRATELLSRIGKMQGTPGASSQAIQAFTPFARAKGEESFRLKQGDIQREFAAGEAEKGRELTREEMTQRMDIFNKQLAEQQATRASSERIRAGELEMQNLFNLLGVVGLTPEHLEMAGLNVGDFSGGGDISRFARDFERSGAPFFPGADTATDAPRFGSMEWQKMTGRKTGAKKWWEIGRS